MLRPSPPPRDRLRARCRAFTLIELLTVIAIILVLAGLLLHVAGNANYKSSVARATAEIQAMSTALEGYKADNGTYPRVSIADSTVNSDTINAQSDVDPGGTAYQKSGQVLFQALSGYTNAGATTSNKAYMTFTPGQLSTGNAVASATTVAIDPFGLPYGYSTVNLAAQDAYNSSGTAIPSTAGYNPTFDLWSTAGYGTGGRAYTGSGLAAPTTGNNTYAVLWAKNW